jgi:hypothetical protein
MGKSRRLGWRAGIGALAMFAIVSGLLVVTATVAEAEQINSEQELKESCSKGTGTFHPSPGKNMAGGHIGSVCEVKGGSVSCNDAKKGKKCWGVHYTEREVVPVENVRGAHGVVLTTQTVPDSQVWKQKVSVADLGGVCTNLGGQFVASVDATRGMCVTPTATMFCKDGLPGTNCVGFSDSEKHADSIRKQVKTEVANATNTTTTPTTPTTSPNAPPTTKTCPIGGCPPPTLPPGKAPQPSVPVAPPQNQGPKRPST